MTKHGAVAHSRVKPTGPRSTHGKAQVTKRVMRFFGYEAAMVFAGTVTPAPMTHAARPMMLANLSPQLGGPRVWLPSFASAAELLCHLSTTCIRDAAAA